MSRSADGWAKEADAAPVRAIITGLVLFVLTMTTLGWFVQGNEFFLYKFFAPKQEAVRRQVFETSRAFNQGMIQELENMQFQYVRADADGKAALASIILHRASGYDLNDNSVPQSLRTFIASLKETP